MGECIGVLAMACKRINHRKNIAKHFFRHFFGMFSAFLARLSRFFHALGYRLCLKETKGASSNKGGTAINHTPNQAGLQAAAWQPVERVL